MTEDFTHEASEIERHLENLVPRVRAVVRQLRAGKTLGEEDCELVAQRAKSLHEALQRADRRIIDALRTRQSKAMRESR